jgi:glycosyltransferase involved in cell wall biosynthesis
MRILIVNDHGIIGGGTETRIRIFIELLLREPSAEVHVLQPGQPPETDPLFSHERLIFHYYDRGAYKDARRIIATHKIDIMQVHNLLLVQPYVLLAAKQAQIPIVWWAHDYWLLCTKRSFIDPYLASKDILCERAKGVDCRRCMSLKTRLKHTVWKRLINFATCAIAPAKILQDIHEAAHVLKGKWHVVTPWIDPAFMLSEIKNKELTNLKKENERKKIKRNQSVKNKLLFVGSLIEFKGGWVAAKAMKKIVEHFPNTELLFVGSEQGPESQYRQEIDRISSEDGTTKYITFLGGKNKKEIAALHAQSDLYLCPTVCMESFGLNWAEAMASGSCVVASAVGSLPEYITDGENGVLFPTKDHDALAACVIRLLSNNAERKKIARTGQRFAQTHFTGERAVKEIKEIYQGVLENNTNAQN